MDLTPLLLRVQRAAAAAAPSEETVGSLLHLALGGGEEATPLELEAGLRALGVCICGADIHELLEQYGVPFDVAGFVEDVQNVRMAPPPAAESMSLLPPSVASAPDASREAVIEEWIRRPMPGPFATHPDVEMASPTPPTPPPPPPAELVRPSTADVAAGLRRADLSGGVASVMMQLERPDTAPVKTPRGRGQMAPSSSQEVPFGLHGWKHIGEAQVLSLDEAASPATERQGTGQATRYRGTRTSPPFAVFTDEQCRALDSSAPARRKKAEAAPASSPGVAAGLPRSSMPVPDLVSFQASWMDSSVRPSSRAGLRPRTASQLMFG